MVFFPRRLSLTAKESQSERVQIVVAERRQAQIAQRLSALQEAKAQTLANRDEAAQKRASVTQALDDLEEPAFLAGALENLRGRALAERAGRPC